MKKREKNKKAGVGFFGENTTNIVIGVVCFVLLLFAGVQIYGFFQDQTDMEKAQKNIQFIDIAIKRAKENPGTTYSAMVFSPTGYWIAAWPYKNVPEKPRLCRTFENCICICNPANGITASIESCDSLGKCIPVDSDIKTIYKRSPPTWYKTVSKNIQEYLGGDVTNINIPIEEPLPIEVNITYDLNKGYEVVY